jgi:hypothetical protein
MAIEVTVGPPLITINRGDTFVLSEADGCITANTSRGSFCLQRTVVRFIIIAIGCDQGIYSREYALRKQLRDFC